MSKRRVVITGIGLVTPIGCGEGSYVYRRLIEGKNGVKRMPESITLSPSCNVTVAATIPTGKGEGEYDDSQYKSVERETAKFIRYALHASNLAMNNAKLTKESLASYYDPHLCGAAIGNGGIGSLPEISAASSSVVSSYKKLSPFFVPKILVNMSAGQVSIQYNLQGPVHSVATACAAGSHSIGDAFNFIKMGYADFMLAGGTDASIDPVAISGFARMKALCGPSSATGEFSEQDLTSSRPFDSKRSGFVIGEGAGILVLEELSIALKRGAPIIAEVLGYGLSGDAHHISSPPPDGSGAYRSMRTALRIAGLSSSDISYFNTHATSTPVGDGIEVSAISRLLESSKLSNDQHDCNKKVYVSSTKGSTGHLLGAAGAVETAFTAMALQTGVVPPTLNLEDIDPALMRRGLFNHVPQKAIDYTTGLTATSLNDAHFTTGNHSTHGGFKYALKNSFGFGGTNASLVLGTLDPNTC